MFEPGHAHLSNPVGSLGLPPYNVDLYYEVRRGPREGPIVHFRMVGEIDGKPFEEEFEMAHDTVFNFASMVQKIATRHGMPPNNSPIMRNHKDYDAVFEDIRAKLKATIGAPLNFDDRSKGDT